MRPVKRWRMSHTILVLVTLVVWVYQISEMQL